MPWCPNCKTEYREGITHCADCKVELVNEYKDVVLKNATALLVQVETEQKDFVTKLQKFLEYSGITSATLEEEGFTGVYVVPEELNKAKKCFKAFYSVETERVMQQAAEAAFMKGKEFDYFGDDDEEDADEESARDLLNADDEDAESVEERAAAKYVSAASRYEDYRTSGITFTVLGGLGVIFAVLNFMEVFTLFGSTFSSVVLFVMFGIFLALGIFSFVKAGKLKESAEIENKTVAEAKEWMEKNFSKDMLNDLSVGSEDEVTSEELLYIERVDQLVKRLLDAFPGLKHSLAEQLVEEFFG
ncbi:MAG: hypothetical protein IKT67_12160 [Lachnospiraceae bacterium]|nr:hypothetical protein [Lachnospiraceae bacterium]